MVFGHIDEVLRDYLAQRRTYLALRFPDVLRPYVWMCSPATGFEYGSLTAGTRLDGLGIWFGVLSPGVVWCLV